MPPTEPKTDADATTQLDPFKEPETGPGPTAEELAERADGKEIQATEGSAAPADVEAARALADAAAAGESVRDMADTFAGATSKDDADKAAAEKLEHAQQRLQSVAAAVAFGDEVKEPLTDEEHLILATAGIDSLAELEEAAAFRERNRDDQERSERDQAELAKAPEVDHAAVARADRMRALVACDRERADLGMPMAKRVHEAIDGVGATHGEAVLDLDGASAGDVAEVFRASAAMGWACKVEHGYALLTK